jgi:hypothetical protein
VAQKWEQLTLDWADQCPVCGDVSGWCPDKGEAALVELTRETEDLDLYRWEEEGGS